jgi:hypothetical protein
VDFVEMRLEHAHRPYRHALAVQFVAYGIGREKTVFPTDFYRLVFLVVMRMFFNASGSSLSSSFPAGN